MFGLRGRLLGAFRSLGLALESTGLDALEVSLSGVALAERLRLLLRPPLLRFLLGGLSLIHI